jgi:hypothetical protein
MQDETNVVDFNAAKEKIENKTIEELVEETENLEEGLDENGTPKTPAIDRFEKKLEKGKKPTAQDSLSLAYEVRHMFALMAKDIEMFNANLSQMSQLFQHVYQNVQQQGAAINLVMGFLESKGLFSEEEFNQYAEAEIKRQEEEFKKRQEEAAALAMKEAKEESVAAAEEAMGCSTEACSSCPGCGPQQVDNEESGESNELQSEREDG